jgi:hypothetical protein
MLVYNEKEDDTLEVDEMELQHMGRQIAQLVHLYKEEILITDQHTNDILNNLDRISKLILNRQYHQLINDPTLIKMFGKEPTGGNFYLDMTR